MLTSLISIAHLLFAHLEVTFTLVVIFSCLLNFWLIRHCWKHENRGGSAWLDIPNERSSHKHPVPKGGGIGFVIPVGIGLVALGLTNPLALFIFFPAVLVAWMGYMDDKRNLSWHHRFIAQNVLAVATLGAIYLWAHLNQLSLIYWWTPWQIIFLSLGWMALLTLTNVTNFMDGIDGIVGLQAAIVCIFLTWLTRSSGELFLYVIPYLLLAGLIGFLVFNFPRAKIFMGDVGSQFLGFTLATLGLCLTAIDGANYYLVPLLMANFLYDSGITLLRRWMRGEDLTKAHRQHLYQLLTAPLEQSNKTQGSSTIPHRHPHWFIATLNGCFVVFQGGLIVANQVWWGLSGWESMVLVIPVLILMGLYTLWGLRSVT